MNRWDPTGLTMTLTGTGSEVQSIWQNLKKLTNDDLVLTQIQDSNGDWTDSYKVTVGEEKSGSKLVGTGLIRRIIDSTYSCNIEVTTGGSGANPIVREDASTPGVGTGGNIKFNPNDIVKILTEHNINGVNYNWDENIPKEIELGHELIHVLRFMGGNFIEYDGSKGNGYGTYAYFDSNNNIIKTSYRMEELATTGISYLRPDGTWASASMWYTTENSLRDENGYNRRAKY